MGEDEVGVGRVSIQSGMWAGRHARLEERAVRVASPIGKKNGWKKRYTTFQKKKCAYKNKPGLFRPPIRARRWHDESNPLKA